MNIMSAISNVVKISKAIKNPKQAISMALGALQKQNPQAAQMINNAMKSGKSPIEFAKEQAENGTFTEKNLNDLKQYYRIAKKMGLQSIPDSEWQGIENAINNRGGNTSGFNGF